jgi:hypothetical protein
MKTTPEILKALAPEFCKQYVEIRQEMSYERQKAQRHIEDLNDEADKLVGVFADTLAQALLKLEKAKAFIKTVIIQEKGNTWALESEIELSQKARGVLAELEEV